MCEAVQLRDDRLVRARQRVVVEHGRNRHEQAEGGHDQRLADRARDRVSITPFQFAKTLPGVQLVDTDDTAAYAAALLGALAQPRVSRSLAGLTLQDTAQRYLSVARQVTGARV